MLVLTRKLNESVWIDENTEVRVTRIRRGKVRLSIKAPDGVQIGRWPPPEIANSNDEEMETDTR